MMLLNIVRNKVSADTQSDIFLLVFEMILMWNKYIIFGLRRSDWQTDTP